MILTTWEKCLVWWLQAVYHSKIQSLLSVMHSELRKKTEWETMWFNEGNTWVSYFYMCVPVLRCIMYVPLYCTHKVRNVIPVLQCIWRPQCALQMNRSLVSWLSLQVNIWVVQGSLELWLSLILVSYDLWSSQLPIDSRDQYLLTIIFGAILGNIITSHLSRLLF